ncbi:cyclin D [Augochlora pura]
MEEDDKREEEKEEKEEEEEEVKKEYPGPAFAGERGERMMQDRRAAPVSKVFTIPAKNKVQRPAVQSVLFGEFKIVQGDSNWLSYLELVERWEQLVVSKLKWELSAVTPGDFLMHILNRLPMPRTWDPVMVRRHAQTFIALSAREYKFSMYTPSMIAAASVAAALHGLDWTGKSGYGLAGLLVELTRITAIEQDYLQGCLEQIEEMVSQAHVDAEAGNGHQVSGGNVTGGQQQRPLGDEMISQEKLLEHEKAGTPTDVRDVHF